MQSMAPPQRPSMQAMIFCTAGSSALPGGKICAPTKAPMPVITVIEDHIGMITLFRIPCKSIVPAEDIASGKFARKTPTTKATSVPRVAVFTRIPMTMLSGTASMSIPSHIIIAACTPRLSPWPWAASELASTPFPAAAAAAASALARRSERSATVDPWAMSKPTPLSLSISSSSSSPSSEGVGVSRPREQGLEVLDMSPGCFVSCGVSCRLQPRSSK
mmetsp:Transcript_8493/g.18045  ORF Transcript_8493/g.18045 Transcript_8493/m.18045 type:complete len:218 (+) Transcript_8493:179-832(+)